MYLVLKFGYIQNTVFYIETYQTLLVKWQLWRLILCKVRAVIIGGLDFIAELFFYKNGPFPAIFFFIFVFSIHSWQ